jgi:hypothetical protein
VLGEIGGNDYNFWLLGDHPRELAYQFIPDVVSIIIDTAQVPPYITYESACVVHPRSTSVIIILKKILSNFYQNLNLLQEIKNSFVVTQQVVGFDTCVNNT